MLLVVQKLLSKPIFSLALVFFRWVCSRLDMPVYVDPLEEAFNEPVIQDIHSLAARMACEWVERIAQIVGGVGAVRAD